VIASLRGGTSWRKRHAADLGFGLTRPPASGQVRRLSRQAPGHKLKAAGYFHKIGLHMGHVGLATDRPPIDAVNALADLIAKGGTPRHGQQRRHDLRAAGRRAAPASILFGGSFC
jgi:hypothetical protein